MFASVKLYVLTKINILFLFLFALLINETNAQGIQFADNVELFMPNFISTKNADVKITFSPAKSFLHTHST